MTKKMIILIIFCILGVILPYSQFLPWFLENGYNFPLMFEESFFQSKLVSGLNFDLTLTAILLSGLIFYEHKVLTLKWTWIIFVAIWMVGVCLGFPLYLIRKELLKTHH